MLCEKCNKREATTHVKKVVNNEYSEYMLCDECAKNMGFSTMISDIHNDFSGFIGSLFSNALPERSGATRCKKCAATYSDILSSKKLGCEECYDMFSKEIERAIRNIHGDSQYVGKVPKAYLEKAKKEEEIEKLREELNLCIKKEEFEKAAVLRDKIKEMGEQ